MLGQPRKYLGDMKQRHRTANLFYKYKLTHEQYLEKLADQNFECGVCGRLLLVDHKSTHLDHNHETGKIREFLCSNCNVALGLLKDDIKNIEALCLYVERHQ